MALRIFLSHSASDKTRYGEQLRSLIQALVLDGYEVWIDKPEDLFAQPPRMVRGIPPGAEWRATFMDALAKCDFALVLWTKDAAKREAESNFFREIRELKLQRKPHAPFIIDDLDPAGLPAEFGATQAGKLEMDAAGRILPSAYVRLREQLDHELKDSRSIAEIGAFDLAGPMLKLDWRAPTHTLETSLEDYCIERVARPYVVFVGAAHTDDARQFLHRIEHLRAGADHRIEPTREEGHNVRFELASNETPSAEAVSTQMKRAFGQAFGVNLRRPDAEAQLADKLDQLGDSQLVVVNVFLPTLNVEAATGLLDAADYILALPYREMSPMVVVLVVADDMLGADASAYANSYDPESARRIRELMAQRRTESLAFGGALLHISQADLEDWSEDLRRFLAAQQGHLSAAAPRALDLVRRAGPGIFVDRTRLPMADIKERLYRELPRHILSPT